MNQALENLRRNLGVENFRFDPDEIKTLEACLQIKSQPWPERIMRLLFESTVAKLHLSLRFPVTSLMKKIRNPQAKITLKDFHELAGVKIVKQILTLQKPKYFYGNYQGAICLTHDVDNQIGWRMTEAIARLNAKHGIPATFNFLTRADYKPDRSMLIGLAAQGFEIGLHGLTHDIALAFRSKNQILKILKQGLTDLNLKNSGFRSPAFSMSPQLVEALSECGFQYDSSIQTASTFYHSSEFHFPYLLADTTFVEIPLTLNDDIFFRDAQLPTTKILEIIANTLENILEIGGVCVINIHPHNLAENLSIYEPILRLIKQNNKALITTTEKIAEAYQAAGT